LTEFTKQSTGGLPSHPTPYICISCCVDVWFCVDR
jgi:hypothetical protein